MNSSSNPNHQDDNNHQNYHNPWQQASQKPWLRPFLDTFIQQKSQNRLPQALLIHSADPLEASHLAYAYAQGLLCANFQDQPCGFCADCTSFERANHPNLAEVGLLEKSKVIRLKSEDGERMQIKEVCDWMGYRSENFRIAIINPADKMNASASNALLKTLEEPAENKLFILVASQVETILPTIASRCQTLGIQAPLTKDKLPVIQSYWQQVAGQDYGLFLMALSQRFDLALDWLEKADMLADYFQMIDELAHQRQGSHTFCEQLQHWDDDFLIESLIAILAQAIYRQSIYPESARQKMLQNQSALEQLMDDQNAGNQSDQSIAQEANLQNPIDLNHLIFLDNEALQSVKAINPNLFKTTKSLLNTLEHIPYSYLGRFFDDALRVRTLLQTPCDSLVLFENLWAAFEGICQTKPRYISSF